MKKQSYFFNQSEEEAAKTDELTCELKLKLAEISKLSVSNKKKLINWLREKLGCNTKRTASYAAHQRYEELLGKITENMALGAMVNTIDLFVSECL